MFLCLISLNCFNKAASRIRQGNCSENSPGNGNAVDTGLHQLFDVLLLNSTDGKNGNIPASLTTLADDTTIPLQPQNGTQILLCLGKAVGTQSDVRGFGFYGPTNILERVCRSSYVETPIGWNTMVTVPASLS